MSIVVAALVRSVVGLIAVFYLSPWKITLGINTKALKKLFAFGIPYQANSFIGMAKDDLLMVFLATILSPDLMGYIGFSKKLSDLPLRTIMDSVTRVTFPAFSRMQHNVAVLRKGLEHTTFGIATLVFPIYISAVFLVRPLILLIPKYMKWEPSLNSFYLLTITAIIASFSTPLVNGISAMGKIKTTTIFMIIWLILTWVFVVPLVYTIGFNGFALGLVLVSFSSIMVIKVMQSYIPFAFIKNVKIPVLGALCMGIWYAISVPYLTSSFLLLILVGCVGMAMYAGIMWKFEKTHIVDILNGFKGK
jgi:O-antigen/teichoic acid export membrane protein